MELELCKWKCNLCKVISCSWNVKSNIPNYSSVIHLKLNTDILGITIHWKCIMQIKKQHNTS